MTSTKTKTFFKSLLLALLVLPVALLFSACGGQLSQTAKCDTSGNFDAPQAASTIAAFNEVKEANPDNLTSFVNATGYRITMEVNADYKAPVSGQQVSSSVSMKFNGVFSEDECAMKVDDLLRIGNQSLSNKGEVFVTGGKVYLHTMPKNVAGVEIPEQKVYGEVGSNIEDNLVHLDGLTGELSDISAFMNLIPAVETEGVKVAKVGNKFRITFEEGVLSDLEALGMSEFAFYFNFDNENNLTAIQLDCAYSAMTSTDTGVSINLQGNMKITLSGFNGEIVFPSFDGYVDANEVQFPEL